MQNSFASLCVKKTSPINHNTISCIINSVAIPLVVSIISLNGSIGSRVSLFKGSASSIVVGARAETFAVIDGVATIEYAYSGSGDYPTIWYCTDLITQEWQEAANGSWEYVPGSGFATFRYSVEGLNRCFFKATSNRAMGAYIRAPIAIKPEGGILVNQETVVYDTVITITVDGKQYRIPAQEVK